MFFVVSALTLMASSHQRGDGAAAFFIRRIFRIVPMFWLSIPAYVVALGATVDTQILSAAFFLQAARPDWNLRKAPLSQKQTQ